MRHTLKKSDRIIYLIHKLQNRYLTKNHKFGIELPKTVDEAHDIDKNNGNKLWTDEIAQDMKNVNIAFDITHNGEHVPNSNKQIRFHIIFDAKMENFRRKKRLVAGGHMTKTPN